MILTARLVLIQGNDLDFIQVITKIKKMAVTNHLTGLNDCTVKLIYHNYNKIIL